MGGSILLCPNQPLGILSSVRGTQFLHLHYSPRIHTRVPLVKKRVLLSDTGSHPSLGFCGSGIGKHHEPMGLESTSHPPAKAHWLVHSW